MKYTLIITLLFAINTVFAGADENNKGAEATKSATVEVKGQVTDFSTGDVLPGVEVHIKETKQKAFTDFDGEFSFDELNPGEYTIVISYISYDKSIVEKIEVKKNEKLSIKLKDL